MTQPDYPALLDAVREAMTLPMPASYKDPEYVSTLLGCVVTVRCALETFADRSHDARDIARATEYLRQYVADHPPTYRPWPEDLAGADGSRVADPSPGVGTP